MSHSVNNSFRMGDTITRTGWRSTGPFVRRVSVLVFSAALWTAGLARAEDPAQEAAQGSSQRGSAVQGLHANGLDFVGLVYYEIPSNNTLRLRADEVRNSRFSGSGTLRIQLWATTQRPVPPQPLSGFVLGSYTLGTLAAGFSFVNIDSGQIPLTFPPNGVYWITLTLEEFQAPGVFIYQDLATFSDQLIFGQACTANATTLCLGSNNRFRLTSTYRTPSGSTGSGMAVPLTTDTGYFWFFSQTNVEMVVKVLNGCGVNARYWLFAGGLTNVEVRLTVTDTLTGAVRTYLNPLNTPFQPIQDTGAFATCP